MEAIGVNKRDAINQIRQFGSGSIASAMAQARRRRRA
jgi:hypothetical protein